MLYIPRIKLSSLFFSALITLISSTNLVLANDFPHRLIEGKSQPSLAPIIEQTAPAVVNIATYTLKKAYNPLLQSPFFQHFFSLPDELEETRRMQSAGSGVIVDSENGYVLTNHHVIANSDEIEVKLQDGRHFNATLIGSDEKVDIALLKIEADHLPAVAIADSSQLAVGDFVLAIGNPFGLGQTVTSGIVSALGRNGLGIQGYEDFIQTDASINPGNSGGALIDLNGRLVGINSAIIAPAGGNVGIGFAIPTEVTSAIMSQLITYGEVRRGGIGARFQDLSPELAEAFSITNSALPTYQGAIISSIAKNSAAEDAGLQAGDVIISANGRRITNTIDIQNRIGLSSIGKTLSLELIRLGERLTIKTEIRPIPIPEAEGQSISIYLSGTQLKDLILSDQEEAVGIILESVQARSNAAKLGFEKGDIIFGVNRTRIRNIKQLKNYIVSRSRTIQAFRIRRGYEDLMVYVR